MRYKDEAEADLEHIWRESAIRFGTAQADALIDRIDLTVAQTIGAFPNAGRSRPELGLGVRSYPIPPYVAFYRAGKRLQVVRVLHTQRDIKEPLMSLLLAV